MLDVIVIGAGPAGLSAALALGRARKRVLVLDAGAPRNAPSAAMHGFLGHDGTPPAEFRRHAREELAAYAEVEVREARAVSVERAGARVRVGLEGGETIEARRALLATGVVDVLPKIPGLREAWGRSAFSCPYCHGYERRDRVWGVLAIQKAIAQMAPLCRAWTADVVLFANGRTDLPPAVLRSLERAGVRVEPRPITALVGEAGELEAVELEGGTRVACGAMLLHPAVRQSDLVLFAGLVLDAEGYVKVDGDHQTSMRGVHAAGDCVGRPAKVVAAAADGAQVGAQIAEVLTLEDLGLSR